MPIFSKSQTPPPAIESVREVRVEIPFERLADIIHFYVQVLGIPPWDQDKQLPGGWGAGDPRQGLYFQYKHDPHVDPMRRRLLLTTPSLNETAQRLLSYEWPFNVIRGLYPSERHISLLDPIGHRLEIRERHAL